MPASSPSKSRPSSLREPLSVSRAQPKPLFGLPEGARERWKSGQPLRILFMGQDDELGEAAGWLQWAATKKSRGGSIAKRDAREAQPVLVIENALDGSRKAELARLAAFFLDQREFFRRRRNAHPMNTRWADSWRMFEAGEEFRVGDVFLTGLVTRRVFGNVSAGMVAADGMPRKPPRFMPPSKKADTRVYEKKEGKFHFAKKSASRLGVAHAAKSAERIRGQSGSFRNKPSQRPSLSPIRTLKPERGTMLATIMPIVRQQRKSLMARRLMEKSRDSAFVRNHGGRWRREALADNFWALKRALEAMNIGFETWRPETLPAEFFKSHGMLECARTISAEKEGSLLSEAMAQTNSNTATAKAEEEGCAKKESKKVNRNRL